MQQAFVLPWPVLAFLSLLVAASAWVWLPARWHAAVLSSRAGRVLPFAFLIAVVMVYGSLLT